MACRFKRSKLKNNRAVTGLFLLAFIAAPALLMAADRTASERWHNWRKSQTRYPVAAWSFFGRYNGTKEEYRTYADANMTWVTVPINQYENAIDNGLNVLIGGWEKLHLNESLLRERIKFSNNSKGKVIGYQLKDEPEPNVFPSLAKAVQTIYKLDKSNAIPVIDMLPNWAWERHVRRPKQYQLNYDGFIASFVRTVKPPVLLCCHYPTMADGSDRPEYYANLETLREHALANDIGLMAFVLNSEYANENRLPSDSDLRWMVYSSLAYGAQGIWYWNWRIKPDPKRGFTEGLVFHETGEPTPEYDLVKAINAEIAAIGKPLMKLRSTRVFHTGGSVPPGTRRFPDIGDSGASAISRFIGYNFLIGEFRNQDDPDDMNAYIMLVNKRHKKNLHSTDPSLRATAIFRPCTAYKNVFFYDVNDGTLKTVASKTYHGKDGYYEITLNGGQGILLRFSR